MLYGERERDSSTASPPLECIFDHIPFSRRWDPVRYYSGIQLDTVRYVYGYGYTAGYSGIKLDTVDLLPKWLDKDQYRDTAGYAQGYGYGKIQDTGTR